MSFARFVARAPRVAAFPQRAFAIQAARRSSVPANQASAIPDGMLQGPGAPDGVIPTDYEQATGIERYQLLGNMAGIDVFDMAPVVVNRMGTLADPVKVNSIIDERIIGCTGFPVDSHELLWMQLKGEEIGRCNECGCCYKLAYHNPWSEVIPEIAEASKTSKLVSVDHDHH